MSSTLIASSPPSATASADMPPQDQAMAATIAEVNHILHIGQVYYAAVIAVVIWDWVLNFRREYQLIWKAKWSAGKCVYIFVRYITTVVAMIFVTCETFVEFTPSVCSKYVKVDSLLAVLCTMGCETVLGLRAWSIWNRNKWLSAYLVVHWLAVLVILLVNVAMAVTYVPILGEKGPCIRTGSELFISFWISIISFELAATLLMIIRAAQIMRQSALSSASFLSILVRDGIVYALIVCSLNIINIGFILQNDNFMIKSINAVPTTYLTAVACCHLVLSLLQAGPQADSFAGLDSHLLRSTDRSGTSSIMRHIPAIHRNGSKFDQDRESNNDSKDVSLEDLRSTPKSSGIHVNTEVEVHTECDTKSMV